jgi:UDP-glucose 4-epimerase
MNVLITGGLGNLGSWFTEFFVENGYKVWVLTKNDRKIETKVKYHLINADITVKEEINKKLSDFTFDYVIHAGSVNDGFVANYAELALQVNTLGTRNLLEYFKDKSLKHFIYLSTFQVYGAYEGNITETTPTVPVNDYGATHLFAEFYVKQFYLTHKIPFTIIRLTNSYGCPKDLHSSKWYLVLNSLAKAALEKKEIILTSNGQSSRDFIWMGDVCKVFGLIVANQPSNTTFNLSGGKIFKMIDVAKEVQTAYAEKFGEVLPIKINEEDKTVHPQNLFVDCSKLKTYFPFQTENHFKTEAIKIFEFLSK